MAGTFFAAAKRADRIVRDEIKKREQELGIHTDPLYLPWDKQRQLGNLNENAYSDWLAWTLEVAQFENVVLGDLVAALFPPDYGSMEKRIPQGPARILREMPVECGHEGQTGRTDLILDFINDASVWHIEVKITSAESADLDKNPGYAKSLQKLFPEKSIHNFLLVTTVKRETRHQDKNTFQAVTWTQLCQRLRAWVANMEHFELTEWQCLIFCAMVEYKLLKICPGSLSHLNHLRGKTE